MKILFAIILVLSPIIMLGTPPDNQNVRYFELQKSRYENQSDSIRILMDSILIRVESEEEFHSPTFYRKLPMLRCANDDVFALIDRIIAAEKKKEHYKPNLRFVLSCSVGGVWPPYVTGKDIITIYATEWLVDYEILKYPFSIIGALYRQKNESFQEYFIKSLIYN